MRPSDVINLQFSIQLLQPHGSPLWLPLKNWNDLIGRLKFPSLTCLCQGRVKLFLGLTQSRNFTCCMAARKGSFNFLSCWWAYVSTPVLPTCCWKWRSYCCLHLSSLVCLYLYDVVASPPKLSNYSQMYSTYLSGTKLIFGQDCLQHSFVQTSH